MQGSSKPEQIDWPRLLAALPAPAPGLHLVSTPIGNLSDISLRALKTLCTVDMVYCEDTRMTARLFERYGIEAGLSPYHDHNAAEARPRILRQLAEGARLALVSDAGTPLISDPGFKLVREAAAAGYALYAVPGPTAAIAALTLSGLPTDKFYFAGFLPQKSAARRRALQEAAAIDASLIFYEGPSRAGECLADMAEMLGNREAALARELTKLHEEVIRARLADLAARFAAEPPRGEIVIIVAPPLTLPDEASLERRLTEALQEALARTTLKTAVAEDAAALALPRKQVYARALTLTEKNAPETDK